MLFELRTYDLAPGKAPVYLEFFRTFGVGLVTRHLPMGGYWMVESGRLNRIEHLWIYEDMAERDACRATLVKDRAWMEDFVPKAFVDVVAQENRFMALESASPVVETLIANRRQVHENQSPDTPMFSSALQALSLSDDTRAIPGAMATFRVVSGSAPGQQVTLSTGDFTSLTAQTAGLVTHEILRPLTLSPLR